MNSELRSAVVKLISENSEVKQAFHSMRNQGLSDGYAEAEIGRALLFCLLEARSGLPNRFPAVLKSVVSGGSAENLPDARVDRREPADI